MKAMILAAGFGKRLRPLTDTTPKPLLPVAGKPLLQHHIEALAAVGITELVINTSWLAEQIEDYFGDGRQFGVSITWSREEQPLETGGGIANALPLLGSEPFLVINGDIWTDFPLAAVCDKQLAPDQDGWLLLVENPEHNPEGDFALSQDLVAYEGSQKYTFSGISLLRPQIFSDYSASSSKAGSCFALRDVLRPVITSQRLLADLYTGDWCDVGTVERYQKINQQLTDSMDKGQHNL
ncbi:nucleotidyltransferase family protein [Porticoccaceae bacterium]|jgi:MurNAc alpha-1-phosphate uridylyltransferase|nr:nucleotidyltransferase family protein [Porticoccaceae bacterium]MDC1477477.1 nucleotidyltransferase family protein [Porticoccaceae bacterium]CAI8328933.1 MAG: D-glycero-alpha-D-manno-heptose 1-phosphate guanylyltransferase [SAR92 bacterium MED-G29]|tara:strand:- start:3591 stop:4304 length:714 start_codon:yes stop_codon:yes gene_type:complete